MNGLPSFHLYSFVLTYADLVALVYFLGALSCRMWILQMDTAVSHASRILKSLTQIVGFSLAILSITSLVLIWWRSATLSGGHAINVLAMLPTVITQTHVGHIWLIRIAALVTAVVLWAAVRRNTTRNGPWWMIFLAAATIAFCRSAIGHAADNGDFTLKEWMDWIHLMAASVWVGSVLVVLLCIFPEMANLKEAAPKFISQFANRLSQLSGIALGVVLLAGAYNAWLRLGSISALLNTPYGLTLDVKAFLIGLAVILGSINRFHHVKKIRDWAGSCLVKSPLENTWVQSEQYHLIKRFRSTVLVEGAVLLAVLLATSVLLQQMPPSMSKHMANRAHAQGIYFDLAGNFVQVDRSLKWSNGQFNQQDI